MSGSESVRGSDHRGGSEHVHRPGDAGGSGDAGRAGDAGTGGSGADRPDVRLVPAAAAGWAVCWIAVGFPGWPLLALAVVALAMGVVGLRRHAWALIVVGLVAGTCLIVSTGHTLANRVGPVADLGRGRAVAHVVLVVSEPRTSSDVTWMRADVVEVTGRGQGWTTRRSVLVLAGGDRAPAWSWLAAGERVRATVRAESAEPADGIVAVFRALGAPESIAGPPGWMRAVERVRSALRATMDGSRPEQAALVPALVVGDTSAMTSTTQESFRLAGLTHLTAVSGTNLTLVLAFVGLAARTAGVRGWWLRVLSAGAVVAFVLLCRAEPSVVRAAAMGMVALAAIGRGTRSGAGWRNLAVAVIGLLWFDPYLSRSAGFALSVLACAGIIGWGPGWQARLAGWLPRWWAEALAVPLAAQVATAPLVTVLSGQVSVVGLIANVLVGPWVGPATVLGLVAALAGTVAVPLGRPAGWLAGWCVEPVIQLAHRTATLPGASLRWPVTPVGTAVLVACCLLVAWGMGWVLTRPVVGVGCAIVLVLAVLRVPVTPGWPPPGWQVVACSVGQGDATVVRVDDGTAILIDTGPDPAAVSACLGRLRVHRIALLVLSHYHADHIGGLEAVLTTVPTSLVLVAPYASPLASADWVSQVAARYAVPVRVAQVGEDLGVGPVRWRTLGAAVPRTALADAGGESSQENNGSVLGLVTTPGLSVLATGDLEREAQEAVMRAGVDLRVTVLKVPHHGSASQDPEFLAATGARVGLIGVGRDNDYGHPAASTMSRLRSLGMTVGRTDTDGDVAVAVAADRSLTVVRSG